MWLSTHFSLDELLHSDRAAREGIVEQLSPSAEIVDNLKRLAAALEIVRAAFFAQPILVSSGYRCPALNAITKGAAPHSAHTLGLAADITCPGFGSPLAVARAIAGNEQIVFDQVIYEYRAWCHIAVGPGSRRQTLSKFYGDPEYHSGLFDPS